MKTFVCPKCGMRYIGWGREEYCGMCGSKLVIVANELSREERGEKEVGKKKIEKKKPIQPTGSIIPLKNYFRPLKNIGIFKKPKSERKED